MVAVLNDYIAENGNNAGIPNRPTDRYSPNGIARVTPKSNRGAALEEFGSWQVGNIGTCEETSFSAIKGGDASWTGGTYMLFTDGTVDGYIWFTFNGVGSDPAPGGTDFGVINVKTADSARVVTSKLYTLFRNLANTTVLMEGSNLVNVRNSIPGARTDATAGTLTDSVITVTVSTQGVNSVATPWDGTFTDPIDGAQNLVYADE
jgi:hypothetical protein